MAINWEDTDEAKESRYRLLVYITWALDVLCEKGLVDPPATTYEVSPEGVAILDQLWADGWRPSRDDIEEVLVRGRYCTASDLDALATLVMGAREIDMDITGRFESGG